jgi:hypothetical protein
MQRADGLAKGNINISRRQISSSTYMSLNTRNEQLINIRLRVLDEIGGCLFCGDGNERHPLIGGLEPNNLGAFNGSTSWFVPTITFPLASLRLLLLFGGSRRRTK